MRRDYAGMPKAARTVIARAQADAVQERAQERVIALLHEQAHQGDEAAVAAAAAIDAKRPHTNDVTILAHEALLATQAVRATHDPVWPRLARARARLRVVVDAASRRKLAWLKTRHTVDARTATEITEADKRPPVFGEGVGLKKRRRTKSAE